ncbi:SDR family oxidoreductase [Nocardia arizonensis]|uniref:SDR family oxidoreductase n=1 Tax=Nocardia arizonensis TaxID=1141647 RepID=UPI0006D20465|nr:SDR family oxidoreductase [Nocardia arizonensis]
MVSYIVTGGTGFLGRRVVQRLLDSDSAAIVHVLVRAESLAKFHELATGWTGSERVFALVGDLTADRLGLRTSAPKADHVVHLGAVYDLTADEQTARRANVEGTRAVLDLARECGAVLHHVSSIAVAGDHRGAFFEEDFDLGQNLTSPYHRTKFAAEKIVRASSGVRWRIYRPSIVVGDSRTGEMDKIDGPYYFFPAIAALAGLPELPIPLPDLGATNIVPVDYVAAAMVALIGRRGLDRRTFHLVNPHPQPFGDIYRALAAAAGAPTGIGVLPGSASALGVLARLPGVAGVRDFLFDRLGIPAEVAPHIDIPSRFVCDSTRAQLRGTGIEVPEFDTYAATLWQYWRTHLDPNRRRASAEVRMPLVRTPMIGPTDLYRSLPVADPDQAAAIVVRALAERPDRIDTPVGAFAQAVDLLMPSVKRSIMHQGYRLFGESSAAQGISALPAATGNGSELASGTALTALAPVLRPLMAMPGPAARVARIVPGLRW